MKVLYTTPILEYPAAGGPQLRIENSIKALSKVCELYIIHQAPFPSKRVDRTDDYFRQFSDYYLTLYYFSNNRFLRIAKMLLNKIFTIDFDGRSRKIIEFVKNNNIEIVWFGYGNISYPLIKTVKDSLPHVKIVCDTDSVWSRFILRELPFAEGSRKEKIAKDGALKETEERAWVNLCEITTAVSDVDAEYYRSIAAEPERIKLFSNVIDLQNYSVIPAAPTNFKKPCIFLAGSFGPNSAMNMAANWVLDEVFPKILRSYPNLHFYIVGRNSDQEFSQRANENVTITGMLESVLPYLCYADVALVPLKFESGTRFKILEAGACRIPLVSTTLGAEGIHVTHEDDILIADEPADFAAAILRILDEPNLGRQLAENCHKLVASNYSIEALKNEAKAILKYLKND
jgi:glycosyltransferase involved in cell wall biosynthesis